MRLIIKAKKMSIGTVSHGREKVAEGKWLPVKKKEKTGITILPDGSAFFVGTVGAKKKPKKKTYEFDAHKLGWKVSDAKIKGVSISKLHSDKYITMHDVFGKITFTVHNKLPQSAYAPGDFKYGYAVGGKWKAWSSARKKKYSNKMIEGPE